MIYFKDPIGNRTHDLPACIMVSRPTVPPPSLVQGSVWKLSPVRWSCVCLRLLDCWFKSHWGHGLSSFVFVMVASATKWSLVGRSPTVCLRSRNAKARRHRPNFRRSATKRKGIWKIWDEELGDAVFVAGLWVWVNFNSLKWGLFLYAVCFYSVYCDNDKESVHTTSERPTLLLLRVVCRIMIQHTDWVCLWPFFAVSVRYSVEDLVWLPHNLPY